MRIYDNGIYRDMTPSELEEYNRMTAELPDTPPEPTEADRLDALESAMLALLGGGANV